MIDLILSHAFVVLIILTLLLIDILLIRSIYNDFKSTRNEGVYTHQEDEEEDSIINDKVIEREEEFDERIARLKEELSLRSKRPNPRHSVADELHPDVKNIPHQEINQRLDYLPDVEVSE